MYACVCGGQWPPEHEAIQCLQSVHHEEAMTVDNSYCYSETVGT